MPLWYARAHVAHQSPGTNYGFGLHTADISPDGYIIYQKVQQEPQHLLQKSLTRPPTNQWIYITSIIYLFALFLYKTTILLLYLRLFGINKSFNRTTLTVLIFVFTYLLSNLLTLTFGCVPIAKYWKPTLPGHCVSESNAGVAYGSMNVVSDVVIFVLPLPMVWRLQLSRESKLGVTLVFMGGVM